MMLCFIALSFWGCASGPDRDTLERISSYTRAAGSGKAQLSQEELLLYEKLNLYRAEHKLPPIPLSPALTLVAQTHVRDMFRHPARGKCNCHSWSDDGPWSPCCYTDDHAQAQCMWDKPRQLTSYTGDGFEISHYGSNGYVATAESSLRGWQGSRPHNAVMLNKGIWKDVKWGAVGVGIYKSQAAIWFGKEADESAQ